MGKHFVKIPHVLEFPVYDAINTHLRVTDGKQDVTSSWGWVVRCLLTDPRVGERLDVFQLYDLRQRLASAEAGGTVEISTEELEAIRPAILKPTIHPAWLSSGAVEMLRAIYDASTTDPRESSGAVEMLRAIYDASTTDPRES